MHLLPWILTLIACSSAFASDPVRIAPGLTHRELSCPIGGQDRQFAELRLERGQGLELRALRDPSASFNHNCHDSYGGQGLLALLQKGPPPDFTVLGAVNGTVFRDVGVGHHWSSNQLLWSKGAGLIAPLRGSSGSHLFVTDARGGHDIALTYVRCKKGPCVKATLPGHPESVYPGAALIPALQKAFPGMTLAVQSNMPLMGDTRYTACPIGQDGKPKFGDWRCRIAQRTVLCARKDGSVSLLTTDAAYPAELAHGLAPGGPCKADCALAYNLDGGGSTQMLYRSAKGYVQDGQRVETSQAECSPYRPVDNYLVIGRPR
jgi:hypothetical protein